MEPIGNSYLTIRVIGNSYLTIQVVNSSYFSSFDFDIVDIKTGKNSHTM